MKSKCEEMDSIIDDDDEGFVLFCTPKKEHSLVNEFRQLRFLN